MRVRRQAGVTLVELLVSIVVVAIAAGIILGLLAQTTAGSADPMLRQQSVSIAEAYLEEVLLRPFVDPDGVDGEASRAAFDDIDDYDGLLDAGARDQFDNAIAGLEAYTVSVAVSPSAALPGVPSGDALRVDVRVTRGSDINLLLSGYRTRY